MEAVDPLLAHAGRVAHHRSIDGDVVGLQVAHDLFPAGLAAVLLAVGDDVDDAAALLGARGKLLGRSQDGVVERVNLLGHIDFTDRLRGVARLQIGIGQLPLIEIGACAGERPAWIGDTGIGASGLGQRKHGRQARALAAGKPCPLLGAIGVGEDRGLVVGRERALDGAHRFVDVVHDVRGQGLIDDESDGERPRDRR